jgi:hypothetical protein
VEFGAETDHTHAYNSIFNNTMSGKSAVLNVLTLYEKDLAGSSMNIISDTV